MLHSSKTDSTTAHNMRLGYPKRPRSLSNSFVDRRYVIRKFDFFSARQQAEAHHGRLGGIQRAIAACSNPGAGFPYGIATWPSCFLGDCRGHTTHAQLSVVDMRYWRDKRLHRALLAPRSVAASEASIFFVPLLRVLSKIHQIWSNNCLKTDPRMVFGCFGHEMLPKIDS